MTSESSDDPPGEDLTEREQEALHEVELGLEWLHRAHGHLVAFHHGIGHSMDHLQDAEDMLRECGQEELANQLRDKHLPSGVLDDNSWTYDVLEQFQRGVLQGTTDFEKEVRDTVADGRRHVMERRMQYQWRERSEGFDADASSQK